MVQYSVRLLGQFWMQFNTLGLAGGVSGAYGGRGVDRNKHIEEAKDQDILYETGKMLWETNLNITAVYKKLAPKYGITAKAFGARYRRATKAALEYQELVDPK
jgi:hypothetical protein